MANANIPAFQTFFNYVLLNIVWTSVTIYKIGFKGWLRMVYKDGWRYLILSFCDVEGNYFTVLGFRYVCASKNFQNTRLLAADRTIRLQFYRRSSSTFGPS